MKRLVFPPYVEPIGWHGFPAPVRRGRTIICTSTPPPEQQVRAQVRSATGMTFGLPSADGAKMPPAFTAGPRLAPVGKPKGSR